MPDGGLLQCRAIGLAQILLQAHIFEIRREIWQPSSKRDAAIVVVVVPGVAAPCQPDSRFRSRAQSAAPVRVLFPAACQIAGGLWNRCKPRLEYQRQG